jgi:hypothetical protein
MRLGEPLQRNTFSRRRRANDLQHAVYPGPAFGSVLAGEDGWAGNDQPVNRLKAGDTFYEPTLS